MTNDSADEEEASIFGDKFAYADFRSGGLAYIWRSTLSFSPSPWAGQGGDADGDGICRNIDNCPGIANPSQLDADGDGIGDAYDPAVALNSSGLVSKVSTDASDGSGSNLSELLPTVIPVHDGEQVTDGGSFSASAFSLTNETFDLTFTHERAGAAGSMARSKYACYCAVSRPVQFVLEGSYLTGVGDPRRVYFNCYLRDVTGIAATLFHNHQESLLTQEESFTLGLTGGDQINILEGSLVGTLVPGHDHLYVADALIMAFRTASPYSMPAIGSFRMTLTPAWLVPGLGDAGRLLLVLAMMSCGVCYVSWRSRRAVGGR